SLALSAGLAACAPKAKVEPAVVVEAFYAHLLTYPVTGAPNQGDLPRIAPFLADPLLAELTRAGRLRDSAADAHPDQKPPFADGDLFTSMFEGPTAFSVMATRDAPPAVLVHFEHRDSTGSTEWVDTVLVARHDTTWVVTDIAYGGTWPMANKGRLRANLK
ncbi:MAG TPA: hypothetical protein VG940_00970, partial [Gemmatimonadales bacterium]|nr:hypothetical protein [Gemmatimonadales bacterium]